MLWEQLQDILFIATSKDEKRYKNIKARKKKADKKLYKPTIFTLSMNLGRKITGGKYHRQRKKKFYEKENQEKIVLLGETKKKQIRVKAGEIKTILLKTNQVNILSKGKTQKTEIKNVIETPQNRFLARQNRLLKSAIIETTLGKAKITNRPSREGMVNAILIEEK